MKLRLQGLLSNSYIFATRFCRPLIFYTINYVRSNIQSLKYPRFTLAGCKDMGIRKLDFFVYIKSTTNPNKSHDLTMHKLAKKRYSLKTQSLSSNCVMCVITFTDFIIKI